jgi:hypothetical protein
MRPVLQFLYLLIHQAVASTKQIISRRLHFVGWWYLGAATLTRFCQELAAVFILLLQYWSMNALCIKHCCKLEHLCVSRITCKLLSLLLIALLVRENPVTIIIMLIFMVISLRDSHHSSSEQRCHLSFQFYFNKYV